MIRVFVFVFWIVCFGAVDFYSVEQRLNLPVFKVLLAVSRYQMGCWGSNPGLLHAKKVFFPLYYHYDHIIVCLGVIHNIAHGLFLEFCSKNTSNEVLGKIWDIK